MADARTKVAQYSVKANLTDVSTAELRKEWEDHSVPRRQSVYLGLIKEIQIHPTTRPFNVRNPDRVEGQCSQNGALTRCPEKPYAPENPTDAGYCGGWHRVLVPAHQSSTFTGEGGLTLTRFIVEAAAGERIPFC
ncbi:hypothetical protein ACIBG6_03950 [Streptomyces sp. NPDC050842]|uniref:hypothetical protein n=1 Tax=Streptomyces sp. NPDC050842 TaxID=3365636 RepID=UPI0037AB6793